MTSETSNKTFALNSTSLLHRSIVSSFVKLNPIHQLRNPVMFTVLVGSVLATLIFLDALATKGEMPTWFIGAVALILWLTLLFANFAEAMAEGRGKAQADSLRSARQTTSATRLNEARYEADKETVSAALLHKGDIVLIEGGQSIPADGDVIVGAAYVDESAVTGESAPVIRESGGDRSAVTGGTRVLSDWIIIRITTNP